MKPIPPRRIQLAMEKREPTYKERRQNFAARLRYAVRKAHDPLFKPPAMPETPRESRPQTPGKA